MKRASRAILGSALASTMALGGHSNAAADLPIDALESHLKLQHGELTARSDGHQLLSLVLVYQGVTYTLPAEAFAGLGQPDLTSIRLKLVGKEACIRDLCFPDYSIPLIEMSVAGIPELPECPWECTAEFILEKDVVRRRTQADSARRPSSATTSFPEQRIAWASAPVSK